MSARASAGRPLNTISSDNWAQETLKIYEERDIVSHVRSVGPGLLAGLRRFADHPLVGEARGMGLLVGIEIVKNKSTKQNFDPATLAALELEKRCLDQGLIRAIGDTVAVSPPLIITEAEIDDLLGRFERGLKSFAAAMSAHVWPGWWDYGHA
jgi:4-aminobutyrate---pyruvate transaminase